MHTYTTLLTLWMLIGADKRKWCNLHVGITTSSRHLFRSIKPQLSSQFLSAVFWTGILKKIWRNVERALGRHPKNATVWILAWNVLRSMRLCVCVRDFFFFLSAARKCLRDLVPFAISMWHVSSWGHRWESIPHNPKLRRRTPVSDLDYWCTRAKFGPAYMYHIKTAKKDFVSVLAQQNQQLSHS